MADGMLHPDFQQELSALLNRHSLDNACETPDFMLAGFLTEQIESYRKVMVANVRWHQPRGIGNWPTPPPVLDRVPSRVQARDEPGLCNDPSCDVHGG